MPLNLIQEEFKKLQQLGKALGYNTKAYELDPSNDLDRLVDIMAMEGGTASVLADILHRMDQALSELVPSVHHHLRTSGQEVWMLV